VRQRKTVYAISGGAGATSTATSAPREPSGGLAAITTGLGWVKAAETAVVSGKPSKEDLEACWNLGATVAATLMGESQ
jgi:hypothetical protein